MKKFLFILIAVLMVALVAAGVGAVLAKNTLAEMLVQDGVERITGLPMKIQSIDVQLDKNVTAMQGMKIYNPLGFPDKVMVDMPEFYVQYDWRALLKKKVHLPDLRIHLQELTVVKNAEGRLNLDSLKALQEKQKKEMPMELQIDRFQLKIDKVIYKDYSLGAQPVVQEFNVDLNETFKDITDPDALGNLIISKALVSTTISTLANIDLDKMKKLSVQGMGNTKTLFMSGASKTKEVFTTTTGAIMEKSPEVMGKTAGAVTEGVKGLFSLPFGSKEEEQK